MGGGVEGMARGSADAGACGECADAVSCSRYMEVRVLEQGHMEGMTLSCLEAGECLHHGVPHGYH